MFAPVALAWDEQECADWYEEHGTGSGSSVGDDPDRKGDRYQSPSFGSTTTRRVTTPARVPGAIAPTS